MMRPSSRERDLLIALSLLPWLTPARTRILLESYEPLERLGSARAGEVAGLLKLEPDQIRQLIATAATMGRDAAQPLRDRVVALCDEEYPERLRQIADPPLVLHFIGDLSILSSPSIALVGSRRATPYGMNAARRLAGDLASAGVTVVSGMARGIDASAHWGALEAGGKTIAVIGTGTDIVYPRSNRRLFNAITDRSLIVSEFAPGTPPRAPNFPIRNRVISGLSMGTVIVEATARSGSLITARLAAEQGREVFAVPGSIFSEGSEGVHRLIQYGAKLVHDVEDVLDEFIELRRERPARSTPPTLDSGLREVLESLSFEASVSLDELSASLATPGSALAERLLELEMQGLILSMPGARYVRVAGR